MNKQEMAEWLAENVLIWEFKKGREIPIWKCLKNKFNYGPDQLTGVWDRKLCELIYSPDGFFAVWDAVERKGYYVKLKPPTTQCKFYCCHLYEVVAYRPLTTDPLIVESQGKDRYECFYNAVYAEMNEKSTQMKG